MKSWFHNISEWISKALSESDGTPSSLRPPFWLWEALLALAFIIVCTYTLFSHFHNPSNPFNPTSIGTIILTALGVNRGSKLVQKTIEPPATPAAPVTGLPPAPPPPSS
jgi:hypothetical protein